MQMQPTQLYFCNVLQHEPISTISLLTGINCGMMPYFEQRTDSQAMSAFIFLPASEAFTVKIKQYDIGNPALSYSPRTVNNSRCFEFVLSIVSISIVVTLYLGPSHTCCIDPHLNYLPLEPIGYLLHPPCKLLHTIYFWQVKYIHLPWVFMQ